MNRCFADTYFYLALVNKKDAASRQAREFLRAREPYLVTTAWILTEVADALAASKRAQFGALLTSIRTDPHTKFVLATEVLFDAGVQLYLKRRDKGWPLTDCISFAVMENEGLTDALTADRHFEQAGFRLLL